MERESESMRGLLVVLAKEDGRIGGTGTGGGRDIARGEKRGEVVFVFSRL